MEPPATKLARQLRAQLPEFFQAQKAGSKLEVPQRLIKLDYRYYSVSNVSSRKCFAKRVLRRKERNKEYHLCLISETTLNG